MNKKNIAFMIIVAIALLCVILVYSIFLKNNQVFTYGNEEKLYEILNLEKRGKIYCDSEYYKFDLNQIYKKVITKDLGSSTNLEIKCYNKKDKKIATIIIIGNRNLVKINGKLYQKIN